MREVVATTHAPSAIGPYSQAISASASQMLFVSGQIGFDPQTTLLVSDSVVDQTKQALVNLDAILKAAGLQKSNVVKTTIFLKDMNDFGKVNEVYATYFDKDPPARSTVEVARLPKDALVEIEAIAAR